MPVQSATTIDEKPLANWLFNEIPSSQVMVREFQFEHSAGTHFGLSTKAIAPSARGPGDIDALVFSQIALERSTAFEIKRVKVDAITFDTKMPGKVAGLRHGVEQVNLLAEIGFYRTYLLIAIVTDGRERHEFGLPFRGANAEILQSIRNFPGRHDLHPAVGLAFVELTQTVEKDVQYAGSIGVQIAVQAKHVQQTRELTDAITHVVPKL